MSIHFFGVRARVKTLLDEEASDVLFEAGAAAALKFGVAEAARTRQAGWRHTLSAFRVKVKLRTLPQACAEVGGSGEGVGFFSIRKQGFGPRIGRIERRLVLPDVGGLRVKTEEGRRLGFGLCPRLKRPDRRRQTQQGDAKISQMRWRHAPDYALHE
jgi:hypothetical protein